MVRWASIRHAEPPRQGRAVLYLCCADHGIVGEGVSAWPSEITALMVRNFVRGGAAINVLCREAFIDPVVVDCGVLTETAPPVVQHRIAGGTRNFALHPAMSLEQAKEALGNGRILARQAAEKYDVVLCGEMGIGNTTSATALLCAYTGADPRVVTGAGAGLDAGGVQHKAAVIAKALALHDSRHPLHVAASFGGFEIVTLAGAILGCAHHRLPVIVDGFISTAAALIAGALEPASLDAVLYSHRSAEPGHGAMLDHLRARPLLDLDLRLGEGTGAAMAWQLLRAGFRMYHEMATIEELG